MSLTWSGVVLDPVQQLLLRQVAELSNDCPLGLQVGNSLNGHHSQDYENHSLVLKLLPDPAKQLTER